jgi:hypothetical protein
MATVCSSRTGTTTPSRTVHYTQCLLVCQQDASGKFDPLNGRYVAPTSDMLETAHLDVWADQAFPAKLVVLERDGNLECDRIRVALDLAAA